MKKSTFNKLAVVIPVILIAVFLLSACGTESRLPQRYFLNPGGPFSTNFNDEDPRRQIRCSVVFVVIDEAAQAELELQTTIIRNSVLSVLGELTMEEATTQRNLEDIAQRIVERANADLGSHIDLIVGAYFTDFAVV